MKKISLKTATDENFYKSLNESLDLVLPVKVGYALSKIKKQVDSEVSIFNEQRSKLLKNHCKIDENGELILTENSHATFISPEKSKQFSDNIEQLLKIEFEVYPLKLEHLIEAKELKGAYVSGLMPIILEEG